MIRGHAAEPEGNAVAAVDPNLDFIHRYVPATEPNATPLLLLHGTGGSEDDLLPLGQMLAPGAALLSPRGKVLEDGMARFFRRLAMGVFDVEDLKFRSEELANFVDGACARYEIAAPIAVGFSNGANIAAAILLTRPQTLAGAVLLRPVTPFVPERPPDLSGIPVLMLSGSDDPMVSPAARGKLAELLTRAGAVVTDKVVRGGHGLTPQDVSLAHEWIAQHSK
jgi:phospholipase/carboxylesterase